MPPPSRSGWFQIGIDILNTIVDAATQSILAQTGDALNQVTESDRNEWWQHVGFISRPSKPDPKKASAQGVVIRQGDHDAVIASRDLRGQELKGSLDYGETCVYAPGTDGKGQARTLYKKDGSIHHYTRVGNSPTGAGMVMQLDASGNAARVLNGLGYGIVIDEDGVSITSKDASLTLAANGDVTLVGKGNTQVDGSGIVIGSLAAPGINSALTGVTGIAGKASLKVLIE